MAEASEAALAGAREPGPVFIAGRQHCGNSLMATMLGRLPGCFSVVQEGIFFEHRRRLDAVTDDAERARQVARTLRLAQSEFNDQAETHLLAWVGDHPGAEALCLYREAMRHVTEVSGCQFWAQKATSYIFVAREILSSMPDARLIYMVRNPLDLCASIKRRHPEQDRLVALSVSWRRGYELARACEAAYPERVLRVSYEQLASDPEPAMQRICRFLGVSYDPAVFEVPHTNPSERAYQHIPGTQGVNRSRVYYYVDTLDRADIAAVRWLVGRRRLAAMYPELSDAASRLGARATLAAAWRIATGLIRVPIGRIRWARRTGVPVRHYLGRRLQAVLGR